MLLQKLMMFAPYAQMKLRKFFVDEEGDVNIVSIVVMMGIAVLLAMLFKGQISNLLKTMFNAISGTATNAVTNPA